MNHFSLHRTDSFSKYTHERVRATSSSGSGRVEEPVYSTLTQGNEPPHEAIALHHIQSDNNPTASEAAESSMQVQPIRSQLPRAEAYQIPINSQENLTSTAPGSIGNFQAMKRHTSSTSTTGYDSTSHLLPKIRPSNSPTNDGHNVISAPSPFNDYEHIDGDDAFSLNSPNSISESPTTPGKVQGRQQSVGNLGLHQSLRSQNQTSGAISASVPLAFNPSHDMGPTMFAVVEEDEKEDMSQATSSSHQSFNIERCQRTGDVTSRSVQQSNRVGGNHSPSGSTGSSSSHGMKHSILAQFQSTDSVTNTRGRESNCSEAPPPYSSRPSSEAVLTADSADSAVMDNKYMEGRQRPWYQASNLSIDSNAQSNALLTYTSTSSSSQASTSTDGGRIQPYATHNEHIPFSKHQTSGTSMKESHPVIARKSSNQQKPAKAPAQPYAEPVRSSVASLGHAQESPTFFEVVV